MKLIQASCLESNKTDSRQADAVLRHRPDVIIFESPMPDSTYEDVCNHYLPHQKPIAVIRKRMQMLRQIAKKCPWVLSDVQMYENVIALWKKGHDIKLYHVDASPELLQIVTPNSQQLIPCRRGTYLMWWTRIFLRETFMTKNIAAILAKYQKTDATILIFLQKFHWINVLFRLKNPTKKQLWNFYFGKFKKLEKSSLTTKVKEFNPTLYKYWLQDQTLK
jgi:hypothetical protein